MSEINLGSIYYNFQVRGLVEAQQRMAAMEASMAKFNGFQSSINAANTSLSPANSSFYTGNINTGTSLVGSPVVPAFVNGYAVAPSVPSMSGGTRPGGGGGSIWTRSFASNRMMTLGFLGAYDVARMQSDLSTSDTMAALGRTPGDRLDARIQGMQSARGGIFGGIAAEALDLAGNYLPVESPSRLMNDLRVEKSRSEDLDYNSDALFSMRQSAAARGAMGQGSLTARLAEAKARQLATHRSLDADITASNDALNAKTYLNIFHDPVNHASPYWEWDIMDPGKRAALATRAKVDVAAKSNADALRYAQEQEAYRMEGVDVRELTGRAGAERLGMAGQPLAGRLRSIDTQYDPMRGPGGNIVGFKGEYLSGPENRGRLDAMKGLYDADKAAANLAHSLDRIHTELEVRATTARTSGYSADAAQIGVGAQFGVNRRGADLFFGNMGPADPNYTETRQAFLAADNAAVTGAFRQMLAFGAETNAAGRFLNGGTAHDARLAGLAGQFSAATYAMDPHSPAYQELDRRYGSDVAMENYNNAFDVRRTRIGLQGRYDAYSAIIKNDPVAAQAITFGSQAKQEALGFIQGHQGDLAKLSIAGSEKGLDAIEQDYLKSFRATQEDLANITPTNARDVENPASVVRAIESFKTDLRQMLTEVLQNVITN